MAEKEAVDMGIIGYLVSLVIVGLVIGGLGRLVVPGHQRISLGGTLLIGLVGSIVGATIGRLLGLGVISLVFEVGVAAGLVYLVSGRNGRRRLGARSGRGQLPPGTW